VGYLPTAADLTKASVKNLRNLREVSETSVRNMQRVTKTYAGLDHRTSSLNVSCFTNTVADSSSNPNQRCPDACPFLAHDRHNVNHCSFQCVSADMCATMDPTKPIASEQLGVCRGPDVSFCKKPIFDGTDRCAECDWGFELNPWGTCRSKLKILLLIIALCVVVVVALLVWWIVDLIRRPVVNEQALNQGLKFREESKNKGLHRGIVTDDGQGLEFGCSMSIPDTDSIPLDVNLCDVVVAGPGIKLFFNFQAGIIIWAILMASGWFLLAVFVDPVLAELGMRPFGTPRDNCILVAWGRENQLRFMWTKVFYLLIAYISSFLLALFHSVCQLRTYEEWDNKHKTMRDFAAMIRAMPELSGDEDVELQLKRDFEEQYGIEVCGVSVAWNFKSEREKVENAIKIDVQRQRDGVDLAQTPKSARTSWRERFATTSENTFRTSLNDLETFIFCPHISQEPDSAEDVKEMLTSMKTSRNAFIVFRTEAEKTLATQKVKQKGFLFRGGTLGLESVECEPETVLWPNFDSRPFSDIIWNIFAACGSILLAMVGWVLVFYAPYALSVQNYNYDNGNRPSLIYDCVFSVVVMIGNQIMYYVCLRVSDEIGFRFKSQKETAYVMLYTGACTMNLVLDIVTTYCQSWAIIQGLGFQTYDGRPISTVQMFPEGFETYAMQRIMAGNTFAYAFPATFLLPFLFEPLLTNILPLQLGKLFVRTHQEVQDSDAEGLLTAAPMDLTRYGDIQLNVVIFIIMFSFPGGYTAQVGALLAICHIVIYLWDHYRVLRVVPHCLFTNMNTDWCAQYLLIPCCGLILSILVFKSYSMGSMKPKLHVCVMAFMLHCIVHFLLLEHAVPCFSKKHEDEDAGATYDDIAAKSPCNWFNTNPVHCLRSKYVYDHSEPCTFVERGRSHLRKSFTDVSDP